MNSLYNLTLKVVAENLHTHPCCQRYEILPAHLQVDVIYMVKEIGDIIVLSNELKRTEVLKLFLRSGRLKLHNIYQFLMDCGDCNIAEYHTECVRMMLDDLSCLEDVKYLSITLGDFLAEAGWYKFAEKAYTTSLKCIQQKCDEKSIICALDCCARLLRVQNGYCCFTESTAMVECTIDMLNELSEQTRSGYNKACIYVEIAILLFAKSQYTEAFKHSLFALRELKKKDVPLSTRIDVLRLCSKGCVVKRQLKLAGLLIKQAMKLANEYYGVKHLKYADTLMDYGFYLLNLDQISSAVTLYEKALGIRRSVFGGDNLYLGISHEDLAYAYYVHEYNNGDFEHAVKHSQKAISIFEEILPKDHLLLASSKRVRALILEEIAIDSADDEIETKLLNEALRLHEDSLALSRNAFGEHNIQTAKHYGNLGRLYQTLRQWEKAEEMHEKAIKTKEAILGNEDYEVALSIGHLASLYNYDMNKSDEAEKLYLRSIAITIKLFGKGYSGLQYDYQGLIYLYRETGRTDRASHYSRELVTWNEIRERETSVEATVDPLDFLQSEPFSRDSLDKSCDGVIEYCFQVYPLPSNSASLLHMKRLPWDWSEPQSKKETLPT